MDFICRRCARQASRSAPRSTTTTTSRTATRPFSSNTPSQRSHAIPTFPETSDPSLNTMLAKLRSDHVIPAFFSAEQRRLVFQARNAQKIENMDNIVHIGGEQVELRRLNRPALYKERAAFLPQIIAAVSDAHEWGLIEPLLESAAKDPHFMSAANRAKLLRHACEAGRFRIVLHCLRAGQRTGLDLAADPELRDRAVAGPRQTAEFLGWSARAVDRAAKEARELAPLFDAQVAAPALHRADVPAAWLELVAVRATEFRAGKDVDGLVAEYYSLLAAKTRRSAETPTQTPAQSVQDFRPTLRTWQAIRLAHRVLPAAILARGPHLPKLAAECERALNARRADPKAGEREAFEREYAIARQHVASPGARTAERKAAAAKRRAEEGGTGAVEEGAAEEEQPAA